MSAENLALLGGILVFMGIMTFYWAIQARRTHAQRSSESQAIAETRVAPIGSAGDGESRVIIQGEVADGGTVKDSLSADPVSYYDLRLYERRARRRRGSSDFFKEYEHYYESVFTFKCGHPVAVRDATGTAILDMEGAAYFLSEMAPETYLLKRHFQEMLGAAEQLSEEIRFMLQAIRYRVKKRTFLVKCFCIKPGDTLVVVGRPTREVSRDGMQLVRFAPKGKEKFFVTDLDKSALLQRLISQKEQSTLQIFILIPISIALLLAGIGCVLYGLM